MIDISRRTLMQGAAFALVAGAMHRASAQAGDDKQAGVDEELFDSILQRAVGPAKLAGVVAMAATDKGPIYQGAYGKRSVAQPAEMTMDSVFWIASMTKRAGSGNLDSGISGVSA